VILQLTFFLQITDIVETIFGLRQVKEVRVGDSRVPGCTTAEKKRVSISEVLAARCLVGAWDQYVSPPSHHPLFHAQCLALALPEVSILR
jgi:hypothetical protein